MTQTKAEKAATFSIPTGDYTLTCDETVSSSYFIPTCGKPASLVQISGTERRPVCNLHASAIRRRSYSSPSIDWATADDAKSQRDRKVEQREKARVARAEKAAAADAAFSAAKARRLVQIATEVYESRYDPDWRSDYGNDHEEWSATPRWTVSLPGGSRWDSDHEVKVEKDRYGIWTVAMDHRTFDISEAKAMLLALSSAIFRAEDLASGRVQIETTTERPSGAGD